MRVIFHGDDFGLTQGVNQGIITAFKHGLLTSTSLMAVGEAADQAMALALDNPGLDVGIHLVLTDEAPLLAPRDLSTLVTGQGLLPSRNRVLRAICSGKLDYGQVEAEWCAQVRRVLDQGIEISHLDSHQFIHLLPGLFNVCRKISRRYNIRFIRGAMIEPLIHQALNIPEIRFTRFLNWLGLWGWTRLMAANGSFPPEATIPATGFLYAGGRMDCGVVLGSLDKTIKKQKFSRMEFLLHPGRGDSHTRTKYKNWGYRWENDQALLLNDDLRKGLERRGIKTSSFGEER